MGERTVSKLFYNYFLLSYDFLNWNVIQNSFPLNPTFVLRIFIVSLFPLPSHFFPPSVHQIYTDWANHYLAKSGHKRLIKDLQQDIADGVLLAEIIQIIGKTCPLRGSMRVSALNPFGKLQFK